LNLSTDLTSHHLRREGKEKAEKAPRIAGLVPVKNMNHIYIYKVF